MHRSFGPIKWDSTLISPVCAASLSTAGGDLLFSNPANWGATTQSSRFRDSGLIRKSKDDGATWSSSLVVTPPGVDTANGGSFGYSSILSEPLHDDPAQGAIAFDHHLPGPRCNAKKPAPHDCGVSLFARFPLGF